MLVVIDLTGQTFSLLKVLKLSTRKDTNQSKIWECLCKCGNKTYVTTWALRAEKIISCGCVNKQRKHGKSDTKIYKIWSKLKERCYNKNSAMYYTYGARGIKVHKSWINDFEKFYQYVSKLPVFPKKDLLNLDSKRMQISLDRIHNDRDYKPGNLKWSTCTEQNNNRSNNLIVKLKGKKMTLGEAVSLGCASNYDTVLGRLRRGWNLEEALTTPKLQ